MKLSSIVFSFALFAQVASAGVLTLEQGNKTIEGVNVAKSATLALPGATEATKLDFIGAGLRAKKVLVANVKVYVAQIFADNAGKFVRTEDGAMASMKDMKAAAVNLTFLRSVDAPTVQVSFRDAFDANDVDLNNKGIAAFLAAVKESADAKDGKSMSMSMKKDNGVVTLVFEGTNGVEKTVTGDEKLFDAILSIWLGEPADSGLETLKTKLIKGE